MEYVALYRKYRPSNLNDVVGQNEIKKILANSVENGTISHAFLFSGPRGTGKTTMAKILAKMVNCESPVDGNPCGKCESCMNIFDSNDIIEIDAASNNGVDEIRELREKASLVPSLCRYKVYIIDEVHMLTTQAFNALLKTLEEPPKHVIFILATTEYHKIPLTITSRCQKFQFTKIDVDDIVSRLKKIAEFEKIDISDDALYEIAKISDGGMRDSINFLDQIRSFTDGEITIEDVFDVCGNVSYREIVDLFINIRENNIDFVVSFFEKMDMNGKNYNKFFDDVISFFKDVILLKNGISSKLIENEIDDIKKIADIYSLEEIFDIIEKIDSLMQKLKFSSRQSVLVITEFLQILYTLNSSIDNRKVLRTDDSKYELAFGLTESDNPVDSKPTVNKASEIKREEDENETIDSKYKEVIINNAFALADKIDKSNLQKTFLNLNDYLTDKKFKLAASMLIDTKIEVVGRDFLILSGNYEAVVDNIYNKYRLCSELIDNLFSGKYHFVVVTNDEWEKLRDEYISKIKSGEKYQLLEFNDFQEKIAVNEDNDKSNTIVDKLLDLVGEEYIEYK